MTAIRYIKLGERGGNETSCLQNGTVYLHFGTTDAEMFRACELRDWAAVHERRLLSQSKSGARNSTNQLKVFFEDNGQTLWFTFVNRCLYWGFLAPGRPHRDDVLGSVRAIDGGWSKVDFEGRTLDMDKLTGQITRTAGFRGTSCELSEAARTSLIRRIRCEVDPDVMKAVEIREQLREALIPVIRLLQWHDFEVLAELIFAAAGWRRVSAKPGTQKTVDLVLEMPVTDETVFVQVKSEANQVEFEREYVSKIEMSQYDRLFFVYHTGMIVAPERADVVVLGPKELARMVESAGVVGWLMDHAS